MSIAGGRRSGRIFAKYGRSWHELQPYQREWELLLAKKKLEVRLEIRERSRPWGKSCWTWEEFKKRPEQMEFDFEGMEDDPWASMR